MFLNLSPQNRDWLINNYYEIVGFLSVSLSKYDIYMATESTRGTQQIHNDVLSTYKSMITWDWPYQAMGGSKTSSQE